MQKIRKCRRCAVDIPGGRRSTARFCGDDCYLTWWADKNSRRCIRSQVADKILGDTKRPSFAWTDTQAAWFAGMIDGEGTIGVWRERRPANASGFRYRAVVEFTNTNAALIEAVRGLVDGYAAVKRIEPPISHHKPSFRVMVNRRAVQETLRRIAPFLIAKKQQADTVLAFCETINKAPVRGSEVHDVLESYYQRCKALNRRGVYPPP